MVEQIIRKKIKNSIFNNFDFILFRDVIKILIFSLIGYLVHKTLFSNLFLISNSKALLYPIFYT